MGDHGDKDADEQDEWDDYDEEEEEEDEEEDDWEYDGDDEELEERMLKEERRWAKWAVERVNRYCEEIGEEPPDWREPDYWELIEEKLEEIQEGELGQTTLSLILSGND